ncbi:MAG: peroxide stress protein YaaA [Saprospiraceae bacterium]
MITILSPAKTLDFSPAEVSDVQTPRLLKESQQLVKVLKKKSAEDIKSLMKVSDKIAELNVDRFQNFTTPFTLENAKPAILAFKGDVYTDLKASEMSAADLQYAQQHVRILSGLYGLLTPMDLMQPYRLEMGTRLKNGNYKNLYEFWDNKITNLLNTDLEVSGNDILLNLASQEYFKSVKPKSFTGKIVNVHFKENRDGKYKVIAFNAKRARGEMTRQIVEYRINEPKGLKSLEVNGYVYQEELSDEENLMFVKA